MLDAHLHLGVTLGQTAQTKPTSLSLGRHRGAQPTHRKTESKPTSSSRCIRRQRTLHWNPTNRVATTRLGLRHRSQRIHHRQGAASTCGTLGLRNTRKPFRITHPHTGTTSTTSYSPESLSSPNSHPYPSDCNPTTGTSAEPRPIHSAHARYDHPSQSLRTQDPCPERL